MKYWTVAPDLQLTAEGYGSEHFVPGQQEKTFSGYLDYVVLHNMLIAVATVANVYNEEYKYKQHGIWLQELTLFFVYRTRNNKSF